MISWILYGVSCIIMGFFIAIKLALHIMNDNYLHHRKFVYTRFRSLYDHIRAEERMQQPRPGDKFYMQWKTIDNIMGYYCPKCKIIVGREPVCRTCNSWYQTIKENCCRHGR